MLLIVKSILATLLIAAGPLVSVMSRMAGSSLGTIIFLGIVFEIIGILAMVFLLRKEYLEDEVTKPETDSKKKKEKRDVPEDL